MKTLTAVLVALLLVGPRLAHAQDTTRDPAHQGNVNAKYVVAEARIKGVPDSAITPELRTDLQSLTGKPLDADQAERLETRLKAAFPEYDVTRVTTRGDETGHINVLFVLRRAEWSRWLRFQPLPSNVTYHSDQGWGGWLDLTIGDRDMRVTPFYAFGMKDDVLEAYSGWGLRLESRKVGTERLGVSLEGTWFREDWRGSTLAALALDPSIPGPYRKRSTFTPIVSFAATRHLSISGGVSIAELQPLESFYTAPTRSSAANAAIGSLSYHLRSKPGSDAKHAIDAAFTVRSGMKALDSDLFYTRTLGQAAYAYQWGRHQVLVSGMAGVINGDAPMFERFSLGDTKTLRGWNKYDISPAGGTQMAYGSIEYRHGVLALFLDSGSVWNNNAARRWRVSTGVGIQGGPFFMTLGVPLNTDDLRAVFTIGLRTGGGVVIQK